MIHPIPSGTRDVLPDEMRELRAITDALRGVFERHGYGEVYTPAIEYETRCAAAIGGVSPLPRLRRPRRGARAARGHDRADRRLVRPRAIRPPSRPCASATSRTPTARSCRTAGQMREFLQAGSSSSGARAARARPRR
jgi:ATP phosphoribosyltransferase regulatory subunit